jgi:hypothetical protein
MNFDYQDLKFWLEDKDVLPQAYWDALEDYDPDNLNSDQVLAKWLGYDHVQDFYSYEMDITYHEEQADVDGYIMTTAYPTSSIHNPPPALDMELYYNYIKLGNKRSIRRITLNTKEK